MQMQDRVGQQFGNYRLIRLIGSGGYSEVYLAEHLHLSDRQYAIKVLTETKLQDYEREKFLDEARTIASLQHLSSHIVKIQDVGIQTRNGRIDDNIPYLVMEYAPEGTLRSFYPHGMQVPLERIVFYVNQIVEALQCAHDQHPPIIHRDVKPANMLLRSPDHLLLSDFGIAVTENTGPQAGTMGKQDIAGTFVYTAPEQLSGQPRRASDQYSLGIVVYEWLMGSCPFDSTEILVQQIAEKPPALYPTYPHVTQEIENVVMRALAKNPDDRYPTVRAFAQALEVAVQSALRQNQRIWQPIGNEREQLGEQLTAQRGQPKDQQDRWQSVHPYHDADSANVPLAPPQVLPPVEFAAEPARRPFQGIREFFEFSPRFAEDPRYSFFRGFGIFLNILSAITIGLLLQDVFILLASLLFSFLMFRFCVRAVEEKLAMFFGTLVALYWGTVGWVIGSSVVPFLRFYSAFTPIFLGLVFFGVSLSLHIWYVSKKNVTTQPPREGRRGGPKKT